MARLSRSRFGIVTCPFSPTVLFILESYVFLPRQSTAVRCDRSCRLAQFGVALPSVGTWCCPGDWHCFAERSDLVPRGRYGLPPWYFRHGNRYRNGVRRGRQRDRRARQRLERLRYADSPLCCKNGSDRYRFVHFGDELVADDVGAPIRPTERRPHRRSRPGDKQTGWRGGRRGRKNLRPIPAITGLCNPQGLRSRPANLCCAWHVDAAGKIFIADAGNETRIRRIPQPGDSQHRRSPVSTSPTACSS